MFEAATIGDCGKLAVLINAHAILDREGRPRLDSPPFSAAVQLLISARAMEVGLLLDAKATVDADRDIPGHSAIVDALIAAKADVDI